uniref:Uncharacterized protein n=1 Tax=viral metagenome TaxID=1070528 RepID=A0A6C0J2U3_9ZZZZ
MEDLRNLMACIDEISSQIPDGMYLKMADQMKRVHEHMNGNKSIHDDTFYYSDDDSELDSDDDSDSDFAPNLDRTRLSDIALLRDQLLDHVKKMHEEYKVLMKCEKEARRTWTPIKRMTAFRKTQAIKLWCEKNTRWAPGGEAGELVGYLSTAAVNGPTSGWTWKNLMENGLRTIVLEIGTDEEIIRAQRGFVYYDELSLKTLQKLPAFEKKIHDGYKEECQRKWYVTLQNAKLKVVESKAKMTGLEMFCVDRESELRLADACVYHRDYWESATNEFWVGENGRMVDNGFVARVERRR